MVNLVAFQGPTLQVRNLRAASLHVSDVSITSFLIALLPRRRVPHKTLPFWVVFVELWAIILHTVEVQVQPARADPAKVQFE